MSIKDLLLSSSRMIIAIFTAVVVCGVLSWSVQFTLNDDGNKFAQAAVALVVGTVGIWALYWAANQLIAPLKTKIREAIRPFIFIGPALVLLSLYVIYPAINTTWISFTDSLIYTFPEQSEELFERGDNYLEELIGNEEFVDFQKYLLNNDSIEIAKVMVIDRRDKDKTSNAWMMGRASTIEVRENDDGKRVMVEKDGIKIKTFGTQNYRWAFSDDDMHIAYRNNLLWLLLGTGFSVGLGLLIATFVDRIRRETLAKTFILLPMAISPIGAAVVWRFVYNWQPLGKPQTGLLNAIYTTICRSCDPVSWLRLTDWSANTLALIVIMIWLQTGFCMVVLSAAIKRVPNNLLEAARLDGANERQLFGRIVLPNIRGSLIAVTTIVVIFTLNAFDIVNVMTGGQNKTNVVANEMFLQMFRFNNDGRGSALAVILLLVVMPVFVMIFIACLNKAKQRETRRERISAQTAIEQHVSEPCLQGNWLLKIGVFLICFVWTLPTLGILVSSFREGNAMKTSGWWSALLEPLNYSQWTLHNYSEVLNAGEVADAFINSIVITVPATIIPITIAAFAAYAFALMRFPGRKILFATVVALLVVPFQMSFIPLLRFYVGNRVMGTFLGMWLVHTAFGLPLAVYLLHNYISQLPKEIFESARIDGADHYTAFVKLALPLSLPAIVSFAIFQFLWVWNDYLVSAVLLGNIPVVTTRLAGLVGSRGQDWHLLTAGAFISMIIPLIVILSLQRYFVRGLFTGSIEG